MYMRREGGDRRPGVAGGDLPPCGVLQLHKRPRGWPALGTSRGSRGGEMGSEGVVGGREACEKCQPLNWVGWLRWRVKRKLPRCPLVLQLLLKFSSYTNKRQCVLIMSSTKFCFPLIVLLRP